MMRIRFLVIALISCKRRRLCLWPGNTGAWRQDGPEHVESRLNAGVQRGVPVERPNQKRAENGLPKDVRNLFGGEIVANRTLFLAEPDHLGVQSLHTFLQIEHGLPHGRGRERSEERRVGREGMRQW